MKWFLPINDSTLKGFHVWGGGGAGNWNAFAKVTRACWPIELLLFSILVFCSLSHCNADTEELFRGMFVLKYLARFFISPWWCKVIFSWEDNHIVVTYDFVLVLTMDNIDYSRKVPHDFRDCAIVAGKRAVHRRNSGLPWDTFYINSLEKQSGNKSWVFTIFLFIIAHKLISIILLPKQLNMCL